MSTDDEPDVASAQRSIMLINFRQGKLAPEQAHQSHQVMQRSYFPQSTVLSHGKEISDMLEEQDHYA